MAEIDYYLIFDQGGQSTRALVFDESGNSVAEARAPIITNRPEEGIVEQDVAALLQSVDRVCAEIADQLGNDVARIQSAGLVTQRSSLVCWNRVTGEALTPVISWQDVRARQSAELLALDEAEVAEITGLRPSPHYGASKIRWCLDNLPEVQKAQAEGELVCGPLASFLLFYLTKGKTLAADPANGSRTLLWNCHSGKWDEKLLAHFRIPRDILPELQPIKSRFGELDLAGHSIPIGLVNGDQCAAFYGRGELQEGVVSINAGTGAFVATLWSREGYEDEPAPEGLLKTLVFDDGQQRVFVAEGTVNGAASALKWEAGSLDAETIAQLEHWCEQEASPPLFMNGVGGLAAPFWQPDFEPVFIGEAGGEGEHPARMVAVLESIVFLLAVNLERLQQGKTLNCIVLGGGLGASRCFCNKLASVTGLPVFRPDETELTARGAAFLLAGRPEGWEQQEGERYQPVVDSGLSERYRRWQVEMARRLL